MKTKTTTFLLSALGAVTAGLLITNCGGSGDGAEAAKGTTSTGGGASAKTGGAELEGRFAPGEWEKAVQGGPLPKGGSIPDRFYPGFDPETDALPEARRGGRVIVHLSTLPKNVNYMVENSAATRRILREVHEFLIERDWETWENKPILAEGWETEDTVILAGGAGDDHTNIRYGKVTDGGDHWLVTPVSKGNALSEATKVPKADAESVQYQTAYTFTLREGIKWHDGKTLDTGDVLFSYEQYRNPAVDCDSVRFQFEKMARAEVVDGRTIRFFFHEQYFKSLQSFDALTILPSHLYNLRDPENPDHDADATNQEQGTYVNEHPNNTAWIGLGPYRMTGWNQQQVDAVHFDDYFDPENGGWVDEIRWRHVPGDDAAKQALINGEIDYWDRVRSEDYYGEYVTQKAFTDNYYKALAAYPYFGYTTWNMRKDKFKDPRVRRALNMCFDWEAYIRDVYNGLASRVAGSAYYFSPFYDRSVEPIPFDVEAATDLLTEAGWYDRDGDEIIDKDGVPFTIEFLMPTGNKASELFGQKYQEELGKVGIKLNLATREWATFLERLYERDYDCANLAWINDLESDPEQLWHSKWAEGRSSNHCGMQDDLVDELIGKVQRELDFDKRRALRFELQRRIYGLQPYMFGVNQPKKLAVSKKIRNFRMYAEDPGYRIREWWLADPEEPTPDK